MQPAPFNIGSILNQLFFGRCSDGDLGWRLEVETHHNAGGDGNAAAAVRVGHDVAVADAQEGDGDEPHGVEQVGMLLVVVPLALTQRPAGDDPQGHHEDEKDRARADGHERLEDEARVEVDAVEGADGPRRCVRKQFTVARCAKKKRKKNQQTKRKG